MHLVRIIYSPHLNAHTHAGLASRRMSTSSVADVPKSVLHAPESWHLSKGRIQVWRLSLGAWICLTPRYIVFVRLIYRGAVSEWLLRASIVLPAGLRLPFSTFFSSNPIFTPSSFCQHWKLSRSAPPLSPGYPAAALRCSRRF
jgi:hypothetical protein